MKKQTPRSKETTNLKLFCSREMYIHNVVVTEMSVVYNRLQYVVFAV